MRKLHWGIFCPLRFALPVTVLFFFWPTVVMSATPTEIQLWLQEHNKYRSLHGVSPLSWSATIAADAQALVDSCPNGTEDQPPEYGQSISFWRPASADPGVIRIVQWWYEEESLYDYNNPGPVGTHSFTNMAWKATTQIGCAIKKGCPTTFPNIWTCYYYPRGNTPGEFSKNVFPPGTSIGEVPLISVLQLLLKGTH